MPQGIRRIVKILLNSPSILSTFYLYNIKNRREFFDRENLSTSVSELTMSEVFAEACKEGLSLLEELLGTISEEKSRFEGKTISPAFLVRLPF